MSTTALLEKAIAFREKFPDRNLADLSLFMQQGLVGAAIADDPDRMSQLLEDVSFPFRTQIGELLMAGDTAMACLILIEQMKDSPYFRDVLLDAQVKADEQIEINRRARFRPDTFRADLADRYGPSVSFL